MNKIPCVCGHLEYEHGTPTHIVCVKCFEKYKGWKRDNNKRALKLGCRKYTPDNLSYVEELAKEKGLI